MTVENFFDFVFTANQARSLAFRLWNTFRRLIDRFDDVTSLTYHVTDLLGNKQTKAKQINWRREEFSISGLRIQEEQQLIDILVVNLNFSFRQMSPLDLNVWFNWNERENVFYERLTFANALLLHLFPPPQAQVCVKHCCQFSFAIWLSDSVWLRRLHSNIRLTNPISVSEIQFQTICRP